MNELPAEVTGLKGVEMSQKDLGLALDVQQLAFQGNCFSHGWDGYVVLKAAQYGILLGRQLAKKEYGSQARQQLVIEAQNAKLERLRVAHREFLIALGSL